MKTVLITGATSGIGKSCANIFAKYGFNLVLTGRRQDRLFHLKNQLEGSYNINVHTLCFDVRDYVQTKKAIASLSEQIRSSLLLLINNAGLALGKGSIADGDLSDWDQMIDTNIKGLLYVSKEIIPIFRTNRKGHIINIASIAGKEVYPGGNVYCATKHAVDALSKAMRVDLVHDRIKVTNIAPGAVETEFSLVRFKGNQEMASNVYQGYEPLTPDDIASSVFFAASQPENVTINDITIMPTAQASVTVFHKES